MDRFLMIFFAGVLLAPTAAQSNPDYPNKPVRIIVNVAPGGGVETATRIIADKLRARLGQPFVVENRPGAGGNIGPGGCVPSGGRRLHAAGIPADAARDQRLALQETQFRPGGLRAGRADVEDS